MTVERAASIASQLAVRMSGARGSMIDEIDARAARYGGAVISLAGGTPARSDFPVEELRQIAADVLTEDGAALAYGHALGEPELVELVLGLANEEGLAPDPSRVMVTAGGLQGLDLAFRVLIDPGDLVVTEAATYGDALSSLATYQPELVAVRLDDEGAVVDELPKLIEQAGRTPKLVYLIPTFQNPTGLTMTLARRLELLELADRYGFVIVEDDPYSRLRFRGDPLPSLAGLSARENVVAVRSFSKTIAPGLRVGWVHAPAPILEAMVAAKQGNDTCTGVLNQRLVAEFLRRGLLDPHVKALRRALAERCDMMAAALASRFGGEASWSNPEGGIFMWITLPESVSAEELLGVALEHGVAFVPGSAFSPVPAFENAFRVCYGGVSPSRIEAAVERLHGSFEQLRASR